MTRPLWRFAVFGSLHFGARFSGHAVPVVGTLRAVPEITADVGASVGLATMPTVTARTVGISTRAERQEESGAAPHEADLPPPLVGVDAVGHERLIKGEQKSPENFPHHGPQPGTERCRN